MRNRRRMQWGRWTFGRGGYCDGTCDGAVRAVGVATMSTRVGATALLRPPGCDATRRWGVAHVAAPMSKLVSGRGHAHHLLPRVDHCNLSLMEPREVLDPLWGLCTPLVGPSSPWSPFAARIRQQATLSFVQERKKEPLVRKRNRTRGF